VPVGVFCVFVGLFCHLTLFLREDLSSELSSVFRLGACTPQVRTARLGHWARQRRCPKGIPKEKGNFLHMGMQGGE